MSQTTKRALEASLKNQLAQKPFNKITINDITDDCGINRMTFYYHFKDIYDLLEWTFAEDAQQLMAQNKTRATWQIGLANVFNGLIENKKFILNVYHHVNKDQIETYLYSVVRPLINDVIDEHSASLHVRENDKKFIVDFYMYGFVGYILEWIKNDMKEDPQYIIDHLSIITKSSTEDTLKYYDKHTL